MLDMALDAVILVNIEPDADLCAIDDAIGKLRKQKYVIAATPFASESLLDAADLLLPIGTFAETSGTYVNVAGTWQIFAGVANPVGESRPAWKVLRVIGTMLGAAGFDYVTSLDVHVEIVGQLGEIRPDNSYAGEGALTKPNGEDSPSAEIDIPIYSVDGLVRRATALQLTSAARRAVSEDGA
jgi:NADH-quinone oxidoreductase subunit G